MLQGRRASTALLQRCRIYLQQACNNSNKVSNKRRAPTSIVLRENSEKLGAAGKCVSVRAGYARNHLVPSRLAALATPANRAAYERTHDEIAAATQQSTEAAAAQQAASDVRQLELVMRTLLADPIVLKRELAPDTEAPQTWDEKERLLTKLLNPVTRAEVCAAIAKQKRIQVAEALLEVPGGEIVETGDYQVPLRMIDAAGRKPGITLSILPIQPAKAATAGDAEA